MSALSRREFLERTVVAGIGVALYGCPPEWYCPPNVTAPVLAGHQDFDAGQDGAPGDLRVFYPSLGSGGAYNFPILAACKPYPLVIVCHGNCEEPDHYKKWTTLPAGLARSGYVVVVPRLSATAAGQWPWDDPQPDVGLLQNVATWMRQGWPSSPLLAGPVFTGVVGHSNGALVGFRLALKHPVSAYASLSGAWSNWPGAKLPVDLVNSLKVPKLFAWGIDTDDDQEIGSTGATDALWDAAMPFKHAVRFEGGGHWSYFSTTKTACAIKDYKYGPCPSAESLAADFVTTFMSKYMPPPPAVPIMAPIPDTLFLPKNAVKGDFTKGHLAGFASLVPQGPCKVVTRWVAGSGPGGPVTLPSPP